MLSVSVWVSSWVESWSACYCLWPEHNKKRGNADEAVGQKERHKTVLSAQDAKKIPFSLKTGFKTTFDLFFRPNFVQEIPTLRFLLLF